MSSVLPAPPSPKSRETTISYLSRLAASKGVSAREYASDMGVSLKRVINQEDEALKRMAYWGRLSIEQLADQVSWAGSPAGDVRLNFRGELYGTRSLRNPVVRGCPHCLREDMDNCANAPAAAMAMRGDWQFRESILCVRHKQPLVPLWRSQPLIERSDFTLHLPAVAEALANGRIVQQLCKPLPYDTWLDRRLSSGQDDTWLSSLTVYAVSTVCLLLGMKLRSLSTAEVNDDWRRRHAALSAGFEIVSRGEDGVRNALDRLALEANNGRDTPKAAFGQLYGKLSIDFVKDPASLFSGQFYEIAYWITGSTLAPRSC
ncbi:TniQ family protein [Martelella mediterranea]|uniref:TniQ family protein n=1 Tax=Martelella mediterranea TaxID=293089 RepID=UPI001E51A861|nr:TniQ family protein [Martelella mediterranea]MCD1637054.1 TniQ family protein [Martelella mediterranea]